ncbi:hypothetical protein GJ496_002942 [Pomphorhynchus laevis]|nr:hypothetical protein GJ496_002942 [Pomphorhynchus laevis]
MTKLLDPCIYDISARTGFVCDRIFGQLPRTHARIENIANKLIDYSSPNGSMDLLNQIKLLENEQIRFLSEGSDDLTQTITLSQLCHISCAYLHHVDKEYGYVSNVLPSCLGTLMLAIAKNLDVRAGLSHSHFVLHNIKLQFDAENFEKNILPSVIKTYSSVPRIGL